MIQDINWLIVGKLVSPHGLHGEVKVNPLSEFPERFTKPGKRWLQQSNKTPKEVDLISGRQVPGKSIYIIRLQTINNRNRAEALIGQNLLVHESHRPKLNANEFHFLDLVGLSAKLSREGSPIGEVTDLLKAGNDLLEIKLICGEKVLVPFVKAIVPEINLQEGWLLLTPPPGLLEL